MGSQIKLLRFGYVNYFNYINEEFQITDGVAVIKGENGVGKTLSITSILPSLLTMDLRKSINMGSGYTRNGRKADESLVHDKEIPSYIWMELGNNTFKKCVAGIYRLNSNGSLKEECVIFKDNVSISNDTFISPSGEVYNYKKFKNQNENLYEKIYKVGEREEYKKRINEKFFKFKNMELFDTNINLIYALSLATQGNSSETLLSIQQNLKNILPDYDEELIRQMEEFYDSVKKAKINKENKKAHEECANTLIELNELVDSYNNKYINKILTNSKALDKKIAFKEKDCENLNKEISQKNEEFEKIKFDITKLNSETEKNRVELDSLDISDIKDIAALVSDKKKSIVDKNNYINKNKNELNQVLDKINKLSNNIERIKNELEHKEKSISKQNDLLVLIDKKINILNDINSQITTIKKVNELNDKYGQNKNKIDELNARKKEIENEITRFEFDFKQEELRLTEKLREWLYALGIVVDSDFSYDFYLNNNGFAEEIDQSVLSIQNDINNLREEINKIDFDINKLSADLNILENSTNPESPSKHIGGLELYECIDFKNQISYKDRLDIESSLKESGILFSVINANEVVKGLNLKNDFRAQKPINLKTLGDYFEISNKLDDATKNTISELLNSITIDENNKISYHAFTVHSSGKKEKVEYIGEEERKAKKEAEVSKIKREIFTLQNKKNDLETSLSNFENMMSETLIIKNKKPSSATLNNLSSQLNYKNEELDQNKKEEFTLNTELKEYFNSLNTLNKNFFEYLPKEIVKIYDLKDNVKNIINLRNEIKRLKIELKDNNDELCSVKERKIALEDECEQLIIDKQKLESERDTYIKRLNSNETKKTLALKESLEKKRDDSFLQINSKTERLGEIKSDLNNLSKTVDAESNELDKLRKQKLVKDQLIQEYNLLNFCSPENPQDLRGIDGKIQNAIQKLSQYSFLDYEIISEKQLGFKFNIDSRNKELSNIESAFGELLDLEFKDVDDSFDIEYVKKEVIDDLNNLNIIVNEEIQKEYDYFSAVFFADSISTIVEKALELGSQIQKEMIDRQQPENISFFIEYKFKNNMTSFEKTFFKKNSKKITPEYREQLNIFVNNLVKLVEGSIDEGISDSEIISSILEEINYKRFLDVNVTFKRNVKAPVEKLKPNTKGNLSEGQSMRAVIEPILVMLKRNLEKSPMSKDAFSFVILDEGFNKVDEKQKQLLEQLVYKDFGTIIVPSSNTILFGPEKGTKIIDYIMLAKIIGDAGKEILFRDDTRSVEIGYNR